MKKKIPIIIFGLIFILIVLLEYFSPKPIDWKPSFSKEHKIPYGSYILFDILKDLNHNCTIKIQSKNLYDFFIKNYDLENTSIIFVNEQLDFGENQLADILYYVDNGNDVFISSMFISNMLSDTLGFKIAFINTIWGLGDTIYTNFISASIKSLGNYIYSGAENNFYFSEIDTLNTIVLGQTTNKQVDFIQIPYGNGNFFINTHPYAFTNYYLLEKNNYEYAFKALSYLTSDVIYWDEYYKPNKPQADSPLRFIMQSESLKIAYYLLLSGLLLLIIFKSKRVQRIIPIIEPLKNTSLEFLKTIGRLYFSSQNHKDIAQKKYAYFQEFLRRKYFIKINMQSNIDIKFITQKTGVNEYLVKTVFDMAINIESKTSISQKQLLDFASLIDSFYKECK